MKENMIIKSKAELIYPHYVWTISYLYRCLSNTKHRQGPAIMRRSWKEKIPQSYRVCFGKPQFKLP